MAFIEMSENTPILYSCLNQLDYPSMGRDREMSVSQRYPPVAARWRYTGIPLSMGPLSVWTGSTDPRGLHVLGLGLLGGDSQTIPVKQTQSSMLGVAHCLAYKISLKRSGSRYPPPQLWKNVDFRRLQVDWSKMNLLKCTDPQKKKICKTWSYWLYKSLKQQ